MSIFRRLWRPFSTSFRRLSFVTILAPTPTAGSPIGLLLLFTYDAGVSGRILLDRAGSPIFDRFGGYVLTRV